MSINKTRRFLCWFARLLGGIMAKRPSSCTQGSRQGTRKLLSERDTNMQTIKVTITIITEKKLNDVSKLIVDTFGSSDGYNITNFEISAEETEEVE